MKALNRRERAALYAMERAGDEREPVRALPADYAKALRDLRPTSPRRESDQSVAPGSLDPTGFCVGGRV